MASADPALDLCMGFVGASDKYRQQFIDKWQEIIANAMVNIDFDSATGRETSPYRYGSVYRNSSATKRILLKDPETHKVVWTYAAKIVRALFGDMHHEYVRCRPSGYEDWQAGRTCTRYLRYVFGRPGHFRTLVEAVIDMLLFGTAMIESPWKYEERSVLARSIQTDMMGNTTDTFTRMKYPSWDDVCLRNLDPMDFYPDPARYRVHEMSGMAKRFRMNKGEALRNPIYDKQKVADAIARGVGHASSGRTENFRRGLDQPPEQESLSRFGEMIGYEYWGDVDESIPLYDQGKRVEADRGVITVLNGIVVRQDAWPLGDYCAPFHSFIINPMTGRFYGVSPAEVIRWDQSFADAIKMLLATAIVRQVHPPIAVDVDSETDIGALKAWKADAIVTARGGPNAVGTLRYDANVQNGFAMLSGLKGSMQEASGALGAIQGESGPDREAASVGTARLQFAMDRPELAGMVLENDCLPQLAHGCIRRGQQFIEDDADLARRIGEDPAASLTDLMGDYDVEFFGSRQTLNRQQRLQSLDRLVALGQVFPAIQLILPSVELAKEVVGDLMEMPDVAALIGESKEQMQMNAMAQMLQQGGRGGQANNGVPQGAEPAGMLPAQAAGGI